MKDIQPSIQNLAPKKLIGLSLSMSVAQNQTGKLWSQFSPRIKEISNRVTEEKISLQIYPPSYFTRFNPSIEFTKWALVETNTLNDIPEGLQPFLLEGGLYAVFVYRGSSADSSIFQYIFGEWLPNSQYQLDDRPHFEILGPNYKNNDPNSEEEIWIPIK